VSAPIWAPWRIDYILGPKAHGPCVFCVAKEAPREELLTRHVVAQRDRALVMLNRYPFASGHLLVIPRQHVQHLEDLSEEDHTALFALVRTSVGVLKEALKCEGLNVGINLGATAGAGIAEHLHVHVVPRWSGDTNFMPVVADTRVVPQALDATLAHLEPYFADQARG
jgi:ATP adenylyltransferase